MKKYNIQIDNARDDLLTKFSKAVLDDRYLLTTQIENEDGTFSEKKETPQALFCRVADSYADNEEHAQRLYDYMSKGYFMPATPILANGGSKRGLPISCFLSQKQDTLKSILDVFNENMWLSALGGGVGIDFSKVRSVGEGVKNKPTAKGIMPFMKMYDATFEAVNQAGVRNGGGALYLSISHPEIYNFISTRRISAPEERKCLHIHHGVVVCDDFMNAMLNNKMWDLKSPSDGRVVETVSARDLWQFLLTARIEVGEPYITFQGNLDKNTSKVYRESVNKFGIEFGLRATQSNMCNEICLKTGIDQHKKERTAVCCLSSLNLEYFDEWKSDEFFIEDIARFLDNVLTDFIDRAPAVMERAKYSAMRERSIGIGVMGWHSFLQSKNTPIESVSAKSWNKSIFKHIREKCDVANEKLANEKGACPDALELGVNNRFSNMLAIAPTASISIINNSSPCIEPYAANVYNHKTLSGSFIVRNKYLQKLLNAKDMDTDDIWRSISLNDGSVQHLNFLTQHEKDTFKTFVEVDQMWLIEQAGDRQVYIDQGQSLNISTPGNEHKKILHDIHVSAWKVGVKGLYYCRSTSIQRAEKPEDKFSKEQEKAKRVMIPTQPEYDECLACQ